MGALYASHYLWVIFAFQVIAAVLLLVNRYVPLAVAVLAPAIVNILAFHALMAPSGLPLALFVAVLWAVIFVDVRRQPQGRISRPVMAGLSSFSPVGSAPHRLASQSSDFARWKPSGVATRRGYGRPRSSGALVDALIVTGAVGVFVGWGGWR